MIIKLYRHCETYQNKNNVEFIKEKEEDIPVTLIEKISDETGKVMTFSNLDDDGRYLFKVIREENRVMSYPIFRFSKDRIRKEIQFLESKGISGEYFVAPMKRRKIRWLG